MRPVEPASPRGTFRLGDWLVQPDINLVSRGAELHHLRPRLMDLLVCLAGRPGEVVSKDRILADVWQQRSATESVLSRSIAELRHLLGDDAERPRVIETIARHGYRVVATVDRFDSQTTSPAEIC